MFGLKNKRGIKKNLCKTLVATIMASIIVGAMPMKTSAHDAYFMGITIDYASFKYTSTIAFDDNDFVSSNHREAKLGAFTEKAHGDDFKLPEITSKFDENKKAYEGATGGSSKDVYIYTFPGIHTSAYKKAETDATSEDMERAYWVSDNLVNSFNDAIKFVMSNSDYNPTADSNAKDKFISLATNLANKGHSGGSVSFQKKNFTISKASSVNNVVSGLSAKNYVTITAPNGTKANFVYSVPKGYQKGQPLNGRIPEKDQKNLENDATVLSWKHVALQGNYNFYVKDISFSQVTEIVKPGKFEGMLTDLFSSLLGGLRDFLGIYSFQELMLNGGQRTSAYYNGIMPHTWFQSSQILHWICQVIAWIIVIGAIVKLLVSRNIASINSAMRVNLIEGIQNLMLTGFMLTLVVPMFHAISVLNSKIVDIFGKSSIATSTFGSTVSMSTGLFSAVIINICFFIVLLYFNFVYIIRAITVALLYGTAPLFIASIGYGGKYKQLFGNWLKELVSNIFMQSFHAICLAFFALVSTSGSARTIEQLVLVYSFIPLTQFFRQNLMGLSGGMAEKIAGSALSTGANMATGFVGGAMAGYKGYQSSKNVGQANGSFQSNANNMSMKSAKDFQPTTSTSATNGKNFNSQESNMPPGTGGMRLSKNGENCNPIYEKTKMSAGKIGMNTVKTGAKVVGGIATMGAMMGASAVGDKYSVMQGNRRLAKMGVNSGNSIKNGIDTIRHKTGSGETETPLPKDNFEMTYEKEYGAGQFKVQDEGYLYHQDLGNGNIAYKYDANGVANATGITNIEEINNGVYKDAVALEYGMDYDNQKFKDEYKELSPEVSNNLSSMITAFKNPKNHQDEIKFYNKQGVLGIEKNSLTGRAVVISDKKLTGINRASRVGSGNYLIQKSISAPLSNNYMGLMPKYTPNTSKPESINTQKKNP